MYELIKTLSLFAYPLGSFFLLALLALGVGLFRRPRGAIVLAVVALAWLWVWSMPAVADRLLAGRESGYESLSVEEVPRADAIVVLGGAFRSDEAWPYPSAGDAIDRYWQGARLYHAGRAPKIILSGGRHPDRPDRLSEAEAGAQFLRDLGVPADALILDNLARNTHDHIRYLKPMLAEEGLERLLLVTSATHMPRAEAVFRHAGLEVIPVATDFRAPSNPVPTLRRFLPSANSLRNTTQIIHEWVGHAFYRVRGWL